jgi:hypothetical protein
MEKSITITFDHIQRELILKYGYPWNEIERQLKKARDKIGSIEITSTAFEWEHLAGDLSRSINDDLVPRKLFDHVDEIACIVESYLR